MTTSGDYYGDWQAHKSLAQCNKFMWTNQISCDVSFRLGQTGDVVKAHRYVLASRSSVFFAMLFGPFESTSADKAIEIPDIEKDIFENLLRYIYCEEINIDAENVTQMLYAARKYGIVSITEACRKFFEENITIDNVCVILENAHVFDENELYEKCLSFIYTHAYDSVLSEQFLHLCQTCMVRVLGADELALEEDMVLKCLTKWAARECTKRNLKVTDQNCRSVLGDLFYLVRFPIMDLSYFADNVAACSSILSEKEKVDLFTFMAGTKKTLNDTNFNANSRNPFFFTIKRLGKVERLASIENYRWRIGEIDKIDFIVSKRVIIHGIMVYGGRLDRTNYRLSAWLRKYDTDEILGDLNTKLSTTEDKQTYNLFFRKPVQVEPGEKYCVHLQMKSGAKTYWSEDGYASVESHGVTFTFYDSTEESNGTLVRRGQIPGLIFTTGKYPCPCTINIFQKQTGKTADYRCKKQCTSKKHS